ncbi:MAG: hypothetical protein ACFFAN_06245 [Promethearchaeota archaeon]
MASKKKFKKIDIRKKRKKIIQQKRKQLPKEERDLEEKKKTKTEREEKLEIRLEKETKLYWIRAATGALSALIGRLFLGLVSWYLFFWMLGFWLGFPFFVSFIILRYEYNDEWNWKNIIKPGIGIFIFLFMIVAILIHTLLIIA